MVSENKLRVAVIEPSLNLNIAFSFDEEQTRLATDLVSSVL